MSPSHARRSRLPPRDARRLRDRAVRRFDETRVFKQCKDNLQSGLLEGATATFGDCFIFPTPYEKQKSVGPDVAVARRVEVTDTFLAQKRASGLGDTSRDDENRPLGRPPSAAATCAAASFPSSRRKSTSKVALSSPRSSVSSAGSPERTLRRLVSPVSSSSASSALCASVCSGLLSPLLSIVHFCWTRLYNGRVSSFGPVGHIRSRLYEVDPEDYSAHAFRSGFITQASV